MLLKVHTHVIITQYLNYYLHFVYIGMEDSVHKSCRKQEQRSIYIATYNTSLVNHN